jgi:hypothetical protein
MSARCKARLILFSGFFFPIGLTPRGDKHTRSDPREPRLRNTPSGCPDPQLSGVHSVLTDGRRQRTKLVAPLATTDSSADGSPVPHRGGQLYRSTTSDCSHSFARQRDRPPRCPHHHQLRATRTPVTPFAGYNGRRRHLVAHAPKRGTSYPCTSSHAARKDRRARCRS